MSDDRDALREELSALIDGALPAARRRELEQLLERDEELRRDYEELRRAVHFVRSLPLLPAPAELRRRLRAVRPRGRLLRISPWWTLAAAAAGVLLAVLLHGPAGVTTERDADRTLEAARDKETSDGSSPAGSGVAVDGLRQRAQGAKEEAAAPADAGRSLEDAGEGAARRQAAEAAGKSGDEARAEALDRSGAGGLVPGGEPRAPAAERGEPESEDGPSALEEQTETPSAPAQEAGKAARGKAQPEFGNAQPTAEAKVDWAGRVLAGERPETRLDRALYLQELEHLDPADLRDHFARLAQRGRRGNQPTPPPPPSEPTRLRESRAEPPLAGDLRLKDRFEAMRTRELLLRVYPRPPHEPARDGAAARLGATEDSVAVDLQLSPRELTGVLAWFDVLDPDRLAHTAVRPRAAAESAPPAPATPSPEGKLASGIRPEPPEGGAGASKGAAEGAEPAGARDAVRASDVRRPLRLVLNFGPRPEEQPAQPSAKEPPESGAAGSEGR